MTATLTWADDFAKTAGCLHAVYENAFPAEEAGRHRHGQDADRTPEKTRARCLESFRNAHRVARTRNSDLGCGTSLFEVAKNADANHQTSDVHDAVVRGEDLARDAHALREQIAGSL